MKPTSKIKPAAREESPHDQEAMEQGHRLSRMSFVPYGLAIVIALLFGGPVTDANPWGDGVSMILVPIATILVLVGLGLNLVATRRGATSVGVWRIVAGLTLVPLLILVALSLSIAIYYALWA